MIEIRIGRTFIVVVALLVLAWLWSEPPMPNEEGVPPDQSPPPYFPDELDPDAEIYPRERQYFADRRN